jgi:hypothetical protein
LFHQVADANLDPVSRIELRLRFPEADPYSAQLVDEELMQRRSGVYWRTGSVPNVGHDPTSWPIVDGGED